MAGIYSKIDDGGRTRMGNTNEDDSTAHIAVDVYGEWRDYRVSSDALDRMVAAGTLWTHGESTGNKYGEDEDRAIYSAERFPEESEDVVSIED